MVQAGGGAVLVEDGALGTDGDYVLLLVELAVLPLGVALGENAARGRPAASGIHGAPLGSQQAGVLAVGDGPPPAGVSEVLVGQALVELGHHLFPQADGGVALSVDFGVALVAHPHGGSVVGGVAHKPAVLVVGGGARLAGGVLALDVISSGGAGVVKHMLEHIVHIPGGALLDHRLWVQRVVDKQLLPAVHHLGHPGKGAGALIDPVVGEHGVGLGHFPGVDAVGEAAHGQGLGDIGLPLFADHPALLQVDMVFVLDKFEALLRGDIVVHDAHGHRVQRAHQGLPHGEVAPVFGGARVQGPGLAAVHPVGVVVQHGVGVELVELQHRGVDGQGLEGGARLPVAGVGVVAAPVHRLIAEHAGDGRHAARLVVNDADGRLHLLAVLGGVVQILPVGVHLVHHGLEVRVVASVDTQAAPLHGQVDLPVRPVPLLGQRVPHVGDDGLLIPGVNLV